MLDELQPETRKRIELLLQTPGITFRECGKILNTNERHNNELTIPLQQRKGSVGRYIEELVTGKMGDNLSVADDGIWDIKSTKIVKRKRLTKYSFPEKSHLNSFSLKENLRITILNYDKLQSVSYDQSGLRRKSKILVIFYEQRNPLLESIFHGIGIIDLSTPERQRLLETDYNEFRLVCQQGMAHTIGSAIKHGWYTDKKTKTNKCQYGTLVKSYSSGSGENTQTYVDGSGITCSAKGRALYLFKEELVQMVEILDVPS